jgi:hypothetical protein
MGFTVAITVHVSIPVIFSPELLEIIVTIWLLKTGRPRESVAVFLS